MSLYRTELRRLAKRRLVRYVTLLGLLVLAVVMVATYFTNEKHGPEQLAAAERVAEQEYQRSVANTEQLRRDCEEAKAAGSREVNYPEDCAEIEPPPRDAFQAEWYLPATFEFRKEFPATLIILAAILALVGFIVGASFVGAEWSTGGMMNLLLWRPRRLQVLLTKLAALLTGLFGLTVVVAAAWTAGFWTIATQRGETKGMTSGAWQSFALTELRAAVLVLLAGVIGFALASLGRHTAMALGGAVAVMIVGQSGIGILLNLAKVKFVGAWLLPTYLLAWMQKQVVLENWQACESSPVGGCEPERLEITWQTSGIIFAIGLVLVLGAAIWAMRRRDIN